MTTQTDTTFEIEFPETTLPHRATPALVGFVRGSRVDYRSRAEGAFRYAPNDRLAIKFDHHTADQFATLGWQSSELFDQIHVVTIVKGDISADDLEVLEDTTVGVLSLGAERGNRDFGAPLRFVDGPDLSALRSIAGLEARNVGFTDTHLNSLAHPERLVALVLDSADVGPEALTRFSGLQLLHLEGMDGLDDDMSFTAHMPILDSLVIRNSDFTGAWFDTHPLSSRVSTVDVAYNTQLGESLTWLAGARAMQVLDVSGTVVGTAALRDLGERPWLRVLRAQCASLDDDLDMLARFGNLRELNVAGNPITDVGLERTVGSLPNLTKLDLRSTEVTREGLMRAIPHMGNLRVLGVTCDLLDEEVGERLSDETDVGELIIELTEGAFDDLGWAAAGDYVGSVRETGKPT